jgi:DNA end-binding protein Ku
MDQVGKELPMARAIWSGAISFGLVSVPVKAFSATKDHAVHFHELDEHGARVRHEKVSGKTGEPVEKDDLKLGYETSAGHYVTFDRSELDDLRPASTKTVDVNDFVDLDDIDPIYYERTYWLGPDGEASTRPYSLLLAAMDAQRKVGIGSVVMRNKQYLAAVRPLDGALAMSTMRFGDEVVSRSKVDGIPQRLAKPKPKELALANQIIDALASSWDPKRYHDTYTDELRDLIERKAKGEDVVVEQTEATEKADVVDLMAALEASINKARGGRSSGKAKTKAKPSTKKAAAPKHTTKATARRSA